MKSTVFGFLLFTLSSTALANRYEIERYSIVHPDYYGYVVKFTTDRGALLDIYLTQNNHVWRVQMYTSPGQAVTGEDVLDDVIETIQPGLNNPLTTQSC